MSLHLHLSVQLFVEFFSQFEDQRVTRRPSDLLNVFYSRGDSEDIDSRIVYLQLFLKILHTSIMYMYTCNYFSVLAW